MDQNKPQEREKPIENYRVSVSSETSLYNPAVGGSMLSLSSSVQLESPEKEVLGKEDYKGERAVKQESENLAGSWKAYGVYIKLGSGWTVGPMLILVFVMAQTLFRFVRLSPREFKRNMVLILNNFSISKWLRLLAFAFHRQRRKKKLSSQTKSECEPATEQDLC